MPDTWTLVTPVGDFTLNQTFHAPKYQPGGVDKSATLRRDGRTTYQRSGDGLATPGPLRLVGRVWRDDQNIPGILDELDAIQEAVAACIQVTRITSVGAYVYSDLAGGPPPVLTPDGFGGFVVEIELWPGRAEPAFVPAVPPGGITPTSAGHDPGGTTHTVPRPDGLFGLLLVFARLGGTAAWNTPSGWTKVLSSGGSNELAVFARVAIGSEPATLTFTSTSDAGSALTAYRVFDADLEFGPQIEGATNNTDNNPPSLTPSWGEARNLWFAVASYRTAHNYFGPPLNYEHFAGARSPSDSGTGTNHASIGTAARDLVAGTENPGFFSNAGPTNAPRSATLAVKLVAT